MPIRKPTVFVGGGITLAENVAVDVPTSVWQWQNRSEGTGRSYAGNGSTVPDGLTKAWQIVGIDENGQVIIKEYTDPYNGYTYHDGNAFKTVRIGDYGTPGNTSGSYDKIYFGTVADSVTGLAIGNYADNISSESTIENNSPFYSASGIAIGDYSRAKERFAIAFGSAASATGQGSMALGTAAGATGMGSVAIGRQSAATNDASLALGTASSSQGTGSVAVGHSSHAVGDRAIAIGTTSGNKGAVNSTKGTPYDEAHNTEAIGDRSIAFGIQAETTENASDSYAIGNTTKIDGSKAIGIGYQTTIDNGSVSSATDNNSIAIGAKTVIKGVDNVTEGNAVKVTGSGNVLQGSNMTVKGANNVVQGSGNKINADTTAVAADDSVVQGNDNTIVGERDLVRGSRNIVQGSHNTVDSYEGKVYGNNNIAIGESTEIGTSSQTISNGVAVGYNSSVTADGGIALGSGSVASTASGAVGYDPTTRTASTKTDAAWKSTQGAVSVSSGSDASRQIVGVAAGTNDTDAVNVAQLKANTTKVAAGTNVTVQETTDSTTGGKIYTVNSTAMQSFKVNHNGTETATIGDGSVVNFKDGTNTKAVVTKTDSGVNVQYDLGDNVATKDDGLKFAGDDGQTDSSKVISKKLNEQVDVVGGADANTLTDGNIGVNNVDGKLKVQLNKDVDLSDTGSVTIGGIKLANQSIANTKGTSETGNYLTGLANKTWNPDTNGYVSGRAATEDQLKSVSDVASAHTKVAAGNHVTVNESTDSSTGVKTYTVNADLTGLGGMDSFKVQGNSDAASEVKISDGKIVDFKDSDNLTASISKKSDDTGVEVTYDLKDDINIGKAGADGKDGTIGVNGKDGSAVVINGKDGSIGLNGKDGANGLTIKGADGKPGLDGKDGVTRLIYETKDGETIVTHEVATLDDGMKFGANAPAAGSTDNPVSNKLNSTVNIVGSTAKEDHEYTSDNLTTTVSKDADGNTTINVLMDKDITGNSVTVGEKGADGKDGKDGTIGVNGKDGSAVVINGKDGSIGLNGKDGANGLTIKGADGKPGLDGKDGVTRLIYETKDGETIVTHEVATLDDGMKYAGDFGDTSKVKLNKQVNVKGNAENEADLTDKNIGVVSSQDGDDGQLLIKLNKDIDLTEAGSVKIGNTDINNEGLTIHNTDTSKNITIKNGDISMGGNTITHVDAGVNDTDAVNVSQLNDVKTLAGKHTEVTVEGGTAAGTGKDDSGKDIYAGENLKLHVTDTDGLKTYDLKLADAINIGGKDGKDGHIGVNGKDGKDGVDGKDAVAIDGKDGNEGHIGLKGKDGENGTDGKDAYSDISTHYGPVTLNPEKNVTLTNGTTAATRIHYTDQDGKTHEVATMDDGQVYAGDNGQSDSTKVIKKYLNEQLDIVGGANKDNLTENNIGVNNVDGKLKVQLNKDVDLSDTGSVTIGGIKLANQSIANTKGTSETGNYLTGLANKTWNPDTNGYVSGRAATEDQLKSVSDVASAHTKVAAGNHVTVNESTDSSTGVKTYTVNADLTGLGGMDSFKVQGNSDAASEVKISDGKIVDFKDSDNLTASISKKSDDTGVEVTYDLKDDINIGKAGADGKDGTIGVNGKDGSAVVINGKDGSIGLNGKDGANGLTIKGDKGTPGLDGKDGVTRLIYETKDGETIVTHEVATLDDGMKFGANAPAAGSTDNPVSNKLNSTVNIVGSTAKEDHEYTSDNLTTTVSKDADGNTTINVLMDKDITGNSVTVGEKGADGKDGKDGTIGVNGKDGSAVVINGKDGSIGLNGKDGANGLTIKGADGKPGLDGKDGVTRLIYETKDGETIVTHEVATLDDGMKYAGDFGDTSKVKLNKQVNVKGNAENEVDLTDKNIGVVSSQDGDDGQLLIKLNKDIDLTEAGSVKIGNTDINNEGLTIHNTDTSKNITIKNGDISMGGNTITHVDAGVNDTDAVNVSQLNDVKTLAGKHTEVTVEGGTAAGTGKDDSGKDIYAGENLKLHVTDTDGLKTYDLKLADAINIGGKDGKDGHIGVNGKDGKDGKDAVAIDGKDGNEGHIGLKGKDGENGTDGKDAYSDISTHYGPVTLNPEKNVTLTNGTTAATRIHYTDQDGKTHEVATMDDGQVYGGDTGTDVKRYLNEKVNIKGGIKDESKLSEADNIGVVADGSDTLKIRLAKNLQGLDSVRIGGTKNTDGTWTGGIYIANQTAQYTKDGAPGENENGNYVIGLDNKTWNPKGKGIVSGRAATEDQLKMVQDSITNVEQGGGFGLKAEDNQTVMKNLGQTVTVKGDGKNIETKVANGDVQIALKRDINVDSVTFGDKTGIKISQEGLSLGNGTTNHQITNMASGANDKDSEGNPVYDVDTNGANIGDVKNIANSVAEGVKAKSGKNITVDSNNQVNLNDHIVMGDGNGTVGSGDAAKQVEIAGSEASLRAGSGDNKVSIDGKSGTLDVGDNDNGLVTVGGDSGVKLGKQTIANHDASEPNAAEGKYLTGLENTKWDRDHIVSGRAATEDQLKEVDRKVNGGRVFKGDDGQEVTVGLGETMNLKGGADSTKLTDNNIGVVKDGDNGVAIKLSKDISGLNSITINNVDNTRHVTIQGDHIDMGGNKITNVQDGEISSTSKDAVNGSQLYQTNLAVNNIGHAVNELDNRVDRVGAGAAALAALHPLDFDPDEKWDFAAGYGNYRGADAVAVGAYYRPNEDTMFSVGGSFGGGENMVNAGVSFKIGQGNHVSTSRVAMAKEIKDLRKELENLKSAMVDAAAHREIDTSKLQLFPDVPANHWAYEYVATLAGNGIVEGYPDGNFSGDRPMTRYEFAAMLYRAMLKGAVLSDRILNEFAPELERFRVDTIYKDKNGNPTVERVRVIKRNQQTK